VNKGGILDETGVSAMTKIDPARLKQLRNSRGWSQDQLADNTKFGRHPKIDTRTISRIESGKQANTRGSTVQKLARALGVELAVLTGEAPIPENKLQETSAPRSSIQISAHARNALYLLYERYHIRPWQVIEIAPFLFCWAAEASLRRRGDRIGRVQSAYQAVRDQDQDIKYMRKSDFSDIEEKFKVEKESIEAQDLFGYQLDDAGFAGYKHEWTENPFARFLISLTQGFDNVLQFEGFSSIDFPEYTICTEEAERLVGGDQKLAERILSGMVALNEMPEEIRESFNSADRAEWVRTTVAEFMNNIVGRTLSDRKEAST
jgi:transcriptional regulator with XRE-family HTH domain